MKIIITKVNNSIQVVRKYKLKNLFSKKKSILNIKYDWGINTENNDEDLRDMQLFCLSISMALLVNVFDTNELGLIENDILTNKKFIDAYNTTQELYEVIHKDKINNPDKYKK